MEIVDYVVNCTKKTDQVSLYCLADIHYRNPGFDRGVFYETIHEIRNNPLARWIGGGDYADWIMVGDKRFAANEAAYEKQMQIQNILGRTYRDLRDMFKPVIDKCMGFAIGNHERTLIKTGTYDPVEELSKDFKVNNLGWGSFIRFHMRYNNGNKQKYTGVTKVIHFEHGASAGSKKGSKINKLEDRSADFDADVYITAHSHDKAMTTKTQLSTTRCGETRLLYKEKVFMIAPSFLRTYQLGSQNYGEIAQYPPSSLGKAKLVFTPFSRRPSIDLVQRVYTA